MKILQVCPIFPPLPKEFGSGVTQVVYNISKELSKRSHKVEVYTSNALDVKRKMSNEGSSVMVDGIKVNFFPYKVHYYTFFLTPSMTSAVKRHLKEFDVIHIHDFRSFQGIIVARYAKKSNIPYVVQAHGSLAQTSLGKLTRLLKYILDSTFGYRLLRDASKVIALSRVEAEQYKAMGMPEEKIEVIPNGIDLSEYADLPAKGCFKKKFGIGEDEKIVLYLGRIHKLKGIDFLVRSFAYLIKNGAKNSKLVIAGPDDGYMAEAKRLADSLKIANKVAFTEMLSEREKISAYVDSRVVVNVEPRNVFGLVPLEAAACSTPVIVSEGNAISDVIRLGRFGFSAKYGDTAELAEIMGKMLENDELLRKMGQRGRSFIFGNCNWASIVTNLEKVYEEVVEHRRLRLTTGACL